MKYSCGRLLPGSRGSARHNPSDGRDPALKVVTCQPRPYFANKLPNGLPATNTPIVYSVSLLCATVYFAWESKTKILCSDVVGGQRVCNLPVWRKNGFWWAVGACSIVWAGGGQPVVQGGRGGDGGRGRSPPNQGDRHEVLRLCVNTHCFGGSIVRITDLTLAISDTYVQVSNQSNIPMFCVKKLISLHTGLQIHHLFVWDLDPIYIQV